MSDKDLRQQILVNSQSILVRHLLENASLANLSNNSLFHSNPIINTLLTNAFCQIALRKVDKSTQTLLRIPTKPNFYIRRGVLKNDVYTVRQRAEPEKPSDVPSSSGVRPHRRQRRKSSSSHDSYKYRSRKHSRRSRRRSRTRSSTRSRSRTRSFSREKSHHQKDPRFDEKSCGKSTFSTQQVASKKKRKSKRNKRRKLKRKMSQIRYDDRGSSNSKRSIKLKTCPEEKTSINQMDQATQSKNLEQYQESTPLKRKFPKCLPPSGSNLTSDPTSSHGSSEKKSSPDSKKDKSRSSSRHSRSSSRSSFSSYRRSRFYSRSTSRSWSSSCSSRSDSRSRSGSSKSRSPSYRNRRRITSARKRPIPYKRKNNYDHFISSGHSSSE